MTNLIKEIYGALYRVNIHNHSVEEIKLMNHPINEHWESTFIAATSE